MTTDGEFQTLSPEQARTLVHNKPVLVCHAPYTCARLGVDHLQAFDVLELFAFVHPGAFTVPTPAGLSVALGLDAPGSFEDYPAALTGIAAALLTDLRNDPWCAKADPLAIAAVMGQQGKGWAWTPYIYAALGETYDPAIPPEGRGALNVWKHLPEWAEEAPVPPPSHYPVSEEESRARLKDLVGPGAETREQQSDYAAFMSEAFAPPSSGEGEPSIPHAVLAEAGTGVGKTLGYLAPASLWAEKNDGSVWISTYTKNLQRQISQELDKLYPDPVLKGAKVAVRKGRENYLCLLNFEEAAAAAALARHPGQAIAAGIMARWAASTQDGDLSGSSFPGWLVSLLGAPRTLGLADRRGECLYSACDHYHRCFVEQAVRKSRRASLVVANHALVMIQTADSGEDSDLPRRYIFDEGHHLFDAADSAFAAHLSALETHELRRWIRGAEGGRKSRARGLKRRVEDLLAGDDDGLKFLQDAYEAAGCLTADAWTTRLKDGQPHGPAESFLNLVHAQVRARARDANGPYSLETETRPLADGVADAALALKNALQKLYAPLLGLSAHLRRRLDEQADTLAPDTRRRFDSVSATLIRRGQTVRAWIDMLATLESPQTPDGFVDWMGIDRVDGRIFDIGLFRHYADPMKPFARALQPHAHGVAVTSATLRDGSAENLGWESARQRTGLDYFPQPPQEAFFPSPFDYARQTKIIVVTDVRKEDPAQVSGAFRALFQCSGGGALGLFTAIQRLREVHGRIAKPLEENGLPLYAQHVDEMDNGTLVDIFRSDLHACLLGTDAVRDGIDVPGDSLRLIVFDRVPWPRPTILHKARRAAFGGSAYDDMTVRLKLRQAYGRLIRRATDRGVFVLLDPGLPSRLTAAFPAGVAIERMGLAQACEEIKKFLA